MTAAEPQAILTPITEAAIFLTLTVDGGAEGAVRDLLADVGGLRRSVGFRIPEGELTCVAGVGAAVWERLFGAPRPAGLHPFRELRGPAHGAPSTPGDLFFHIRAHRLDLCFELAQLLVDRLRPHARVVVRRQAARELRPHPRLLHRAHRQSLLRAQRRLPRGPAGPRCRRGPRRRGCPGVDRGPLDPRGRSGAHALARRRRSSPCPSSTSAGSRSRSAGRGRSRNESSR